MSCQRSMENVYISIEELKETGYSIYKLEDRIYSVIGRECMNHVYCKNCVFDKYTKHINKIYTRLANEPGSYELSDELIAQIWILKKQMVTKHLGHIKLLRISGV